MAKRIFHHDYLLTIHQFGSQIVTADDLIAAGWLIEAGYAKAEDDHEGPRISLTKSGEALLRKKARA